MSARADILKWVAVDGPVTALELAAALGRPPQTIRAAICVIRTTPGILRIAAWERSVLTGGRFKPSYVCGKGPDAPPPPPMSEAERKARYRQKNRALLRAKARKARANRLPAWVPY